MQEFDVVVIGAGAAGCFSAIQAAAANPGARIVILEKSNKALAKVKISGGGRCNVTNAESDPEELSKNYPRGRRFLKKAFFEFSSSHMTEWLKKRGIDLRLYPDGCLFPVTNDSQTIIDCFLRELKAANIDIRLSEKVDEISATDDRWKIVSSSGEYMAHSVLVTAGGQPKATGFGFLEGLGLKIVEPLPSLFTFNMPNENIRELMGIVTENAFVRIAGEKWSSSGPLLITHWGMSGPAVLKCSAFGARILAGKNYETDVIVNWTGELKQDVIRAELSEYAGSAKKMVNTPLFGLKGRLWTFILQRCGLPEEKTWAELGTKQLGRLTETLHGDVYRMKGKTTFKEEFVTAGGIDLSEIDAATMEAKRFPGLFFAGEVMDIDGITGGYNFQAAWTTSRVAGKSVLLRKR
jgi:predicted Rossmann fold flavoprotein